MTFGTHVDLTFTGANRRYRFLVEREHNNSDQPTKRIDRDALLPLIDQSTAPAIALAHTVSREELRSRAVTRNDIATTEMAPFERPAAPLEEPVDTDISPTVSPMLIGMVILLLVVAFIAAASTH